MDQAGTLSHVVTLMDAAGSILTLPEGHLSAWVTSGKRKESV